MLSGMELKLKRIVLGVKAQEVAKYLNVSNVFVTYMEKGVKKIPKDKYILWVDFLGNKNK